jgi:hypothetical protein
MHWTVHACPPTIVHVRSPVREPAADSVTFGDVGLDEQTTCTCSGSVDLLPPHGLRSRTVLVPATVASIRTSEITPSADWAAETSHPPLLLSVVKAAGSFFGKNGKSLI